MRPLLVAAVSVLALAVVSAPEPARANGRFPKAQTILLPHGARNEDTIFLRATFGVLVSHDGGSTWGWLCEQALGFSSAWDPPIASTRDGRLWVALADGARSTADGCAVTGAPELKGELVADLTVDGSGDHVYAVTSTPGKPAFVWHTQGAESASSAPPPFVRIGKGLSGFRFDTIDVAPSKPSRLYLTATPDGRGPLAHLFRSDDGGATLTELSTALAVDARLFVSAVDPKNADRLYVRALSAKGSEVLLSTDGGKTLKSVLHVKGAMFGFAQTPDGSILYAGSGDPAEGIYRSFDRGATWEEGAKTSVFCLNAQGPRLLICSNPYVPSGYAVAESTDQGVTVKSLATFDDVKGPIACDAGAPSPCDSAWPATHAAIVTSAQLRPPPPPDAGSEASDAAPVPPTGEAPPPPHGSACGCRTAGAEAAGHGWLSGIAVVFVALRRRRRSLV